MQEEEWQPYIEHLQRLEPHWPFEALERLLILTARYGYGGGWATTPDERAEQEERRGAALLGAGDAQKRDNANVNRFTESHNQALRLSH